MARPAGGQNPVVAGGSKLGPSCRAKPDPQGGEILQSPGATSPDLQPLENSPRMMLFEDARIITTAKKWLIIARAWMISEWRSDPLVVSRVTPKTPAAT